MHAAVQHLQGTMPVYPRVARFELRAVTWPITFTAPAPATAATVPMVAAKPREFFIQGLTKDGRAFRPSDWAERLAGALSSFKPPGAAVAIGSHISYSPFCVPRVIDNVKCVIVSEALRDLEPMAWDFAMNFARDNELQVVEACLLPDPPAPA